MLVAASVAWLVFGVWYPTPFHELTGGRTLFLILMAVDVVCGPVLTLVLFDPAKSRFKWRLDLALIVFTQLTALAYGLNQVAAARPVFVAFEGDRFRLVQALDIDESRLQEAPRGWTHPVFVDRACSASNCLGPPIRTTCPACSFPSKGCTLLSVRHAGGHTNSRPPQCS
ncbi:hypothetical protein [Hydrogenophaga sp.]|uniref:hypothetical protein n=1 Tax=Hydrogenophaga sp. TaxID=1904254 RepID=UPI003D28EFC0